MHLNMCSPTPPMPARTYNTSQLVVTKPPPMPARTQDASHVLTLVIQCQPGHKMFLSLCWPNLPHASEYTNCISRRDWQTHPMPARTHIVSQHVVTQAIPCQRGQKNHRNMCWANPSHSSKDTKCISTRVDKAHPMSQNATELVLTSHAKEDKKCFLICIDQTPSMPARTQNTSQHYKVSREKLEPEPGFEPRTSGFLARRSATRAILVLMPVHVQISLEGPRFESRFWFKFFSWDLIM